jgi:transglutaminase-like putative cysteine protease
MAPQALLLVPILLASSGSGPGSGTGNSLPALAPKVAETRLFKIRQTVTLSDVPEDAGQVRLWVTVPADGAWQHVLDRKVVEAPAGWTLEAQPESDAEMVVATTAATGTVRVVVETTVARQSPVFDLTPSGGEIQAELFTGELTQDAPLMSVDEQVLELGRKACAGVTDPREKVVRLLNAVADVADHYSKDPTKPSCGRGAAEDCLTNGGGCCTDLHSLFIALARARGIPARLQMGYRLLEKNVGKEVDPGYRCWVEYFVPGYGWVSADIVEADAPDGPGRTRWFSGLTARRLWLNQGRDFVLEGAQIRERVNHMRLGYAELDGVPARVLPDGDLKPQLTRKVQFSELGTETSAALAAKAQ